MHLGYNSLIFASREGHNNVVRVLLDKNANVNAMDPHGKLEFIYLMYYAKCLSCKNGKILI